MASVGSHALPSVEVSHESDVIDNHPTDYYHTPESIVHIGAHATHVTVYVDS